MSFKTMDGVTVYDKQDVDNLLEPVAQNATDAKQAATALGNSKADRSEMNLEFSADRQRLTALENGKADNADVAADRQRLTALENGKADKTEVPTMVANTVNDIITTKVQAITSDINHIVDNAIDDELEDYDDSHAVDDKITTAVDGLASEQYVNQAIAAIPNPGVASTADVTAIVNQYF